MKKIFVQKVEQDGTEFYTGIADPRDLIRLVDDIEVGKEQDAQRPISERKVKEIADYIVDKRPFGMLPTSVTLGTKVRDKIVVQKIREEIPGMTGLESYYIELPESDVEFNDFKGTIDIMDGQHRLFSFKDDYRRLEDNRKYQLVFSLFIYPTIDEKRQIFMTTNEKQDKVSSNLLMWFRDKLNMLKGPEKEYRTIVQMLNDEARSPLKGRIIMGAETVRRGYKAQQLIKIFDKADLRSLAAHGEKLTDAQLFTVICTYLIGWETYYQVSYSNPQKNEGPITKISGLRYIFLLLPKYWNFSIKSRQKFNNDLVTSVIGQLTEAVDIGLNKSVFEDDASLLAFRSEGATVKLAEEHGKALELQLQRVNEENEFNPL